MVLSRLNDDAFFGLSWQWVYHFVMEIYAFEQVDEKNDEWEVILIGPGKNHNEWFAPIWKWGSCDWTFDWRAKCHAS